MIERFVRWYVQHYMPEFELRVKIRTPEELRAWARLTFPGFHAAKNPAKRKGVNHDIANVA